MSAASVGLVFPERLVSASRARAVLSVAGFGDAPLEATRLVLRADHAPCVGVRLRSVLPAAEERVLAGLLRDCAPGPVLVLRSAGWGRSLELTGRGRAPRSLTLREGQAVLYEGRRVRAVEVAEAVGVARSLLAPFRPSLRPTFSGVGIDGLLREVCELARAPHAAQPRSSLERRAYARLADRLGVGAGRRWEIVSRVHGDPRSADPARTLALAAPRAPAERVYARALVAHAWARGRPERDAGRAAAVWTGERSPAGIVLDFVHEVGVRGPRARGFLPLVDRVEPDELGRDDRTLRRRLAVAVDLARHGSLATLLHVMRTATRTPWLIEALEAAPTAGALIDPAEQALWSTTTAALSTSGVSATRRHELRCGVLTLLVADVAPEAQRSTLRGLTGLWGAARLERWLRDAIGAVGAPRPGSRGEALAARLTRARTQLGGVRAAPHTHEDTLLDGRPAWTHAGHATEAP